MSFHRPAAATRPITTAPHHGYGARNSPSHAPAATRTSLTTRFQARCAYGLPYASPNAVR
ncbi:hypothetical protein ACIBG4_34195 [Nonomuraea sp. NPDC050383]|uniref:hypothetical protein n=1 Tax=Nonomuraea sp. NPDC050383 TaxID=3364362 RepID=UPI0037B405C6